MQTLMTGCSGLVGSALIEFLFQKGHSIQCLQRNLKPDAPHFWATENLPEDTAKTYDTVIHLAGENVASGRWSKKKKERIYQSRIESTRDLVDFISLLSQKPSTVLCASAVGYYGSMGDTLLNERNGLGKGFLAEVCRDWEREIGRLSSLGIRVVNLRFGMVLSPHGGALQKMLPPFKMGLGGTMGDGSQFISWISIRDLVHIIDFVINHTSIKGPVNVVSPIPTTNKILTKTLGKCLNKPTLFRVPEIALKLIFGQMAEEMLLSSGRVSPAVLMEHEYNFLDQSLEKVIQGTLSAEKS